MHGYKKPKVDWKRNRTRHDNKEYDDGFDEFSKKNRKKQKQYFQRDDGDDENRFSRMNNDR